MSSAGGGHIGFIVAVCLMHVGEERRVNRNDLKPYEFARRRFCHMNLVLSDVDRSVHERLLDALVALAPIRVEDLPRSSHLLFERVQNLVGPTLWLDVATSGSLAPAVRALSVRQAEDAVRWISMAGDILNEQSEPDFGEYNQERRRRQFGGFDLT